MEAELEGMDPEQQDEAPGFEALPAATQRELKKLRSAERALRKKNAQLAEDALTARFGADVVAMIPEEVSTYERRVELAETFSEQLKPAPAPEPVEEEDEPIGLAFVARAPTGGFTTTSRDLMTTQEVKELAKTDPAAAEALIKAGRYKQLGRWDGVGYVADVDAM